MAVLVAFLQTEFKVLRVKNRFAKDEVEKVGAERLVVGIRSPFLEGYDCQRVVHVLL